MGNRDGDGENKLIIFASSNLSSEMSLFVVEILELEM